MDGLTVTFVNLGIPLGLVLIGLIVGSILEKNISNQLENVKN